MEHISILQLILRGIDVLLELYGAVDVLLRDEDLNAIPRSVSNLRSKLRSKLRSTVFEAP